MCDKLFLMVVIKKYTKKLLIILAGVALIIAVYLIAGKNFLYTIDKYTFFIFQNQNANVQPSKNATIISENRISNELYGKVVANTDSSLRIREITRYKNLDSNEDVVYVISTNTKTIITYQDIITNEFLSLTSAPKKGLISDIQKDWYVKVEYDSEKAETTTSKDGTTITTIPALKIDYSRPEYPPFLQ